MIHYRFVLFLTSVLTLSGLSLSQASTDVQAGNNQEQGNSRPLLRAFGQRNNDRGTWSGQQMNTSSRNASSDGKQISWLQQQRQKQQQYFQQRQKQLSQQKQNQQRSVQGQNPQASRFQIFKQSQNQQSRQQRTVQPQAPRVSGNASQTTVSGQALESSYEDVLKPSSSKNSAMEALRRIPWNSLSPQDYQKAQSVVSKYSVFRRLPLAGAYCNPEVFDYCLLHPEIVVGLWREMGYSQITMKQEQSNLFSLNDSGGTVGKIEVLYHDNENILVYCWGSYKTPVGNRALEGEILLFIQTRYSEDSKMQPLVVCRADSFVKINNVGVEMVSKVFAPMLGKIADANFTQTVGFVGSISELAEKAPKEMYTRIDGLTELVAPKVQEDLYQIAASVWSEANERSQGAVVEYRLNAKKNQPNETYARIVNRKQEPTSQSETVVQEEKGVHSKITDLEGIHLLDSLPKEAELSNSRNTTDKHLDRRSSTPIKEETIPQIETSVEKAGLPELPLLPESEKTVPDSANNKKTFGIAVPVDTRKTQYAESDPEVALALDASASNAGSKSNQANEIRPLSDVSQTLPAIPFDETMFEKKNSDESIIDTQKSDQTMTGNKTGLNDQKEIKTVKVSSNPNFSVNMENEKKKVSTLPILTFADNKDLEEVNDNKKAEKEILSEKTSEVYEPVFKQKTVVVEKKTASKNSNDLNQEKQDTSKPGSSWFKKNSGSVLSASVSNDEKEKTPESPSEKSDGGWRVVK